MKTSKKLILILIACILGILLLALMPRVGGNSSIPNDNDQIACTMDALICPDGSAVGRSGPQCEFSACNNLDSIKGRLTQTDNGYILVTASPEGQTEEVTYSLPLTFSRISNVLGDLIGEEVIVKGSFTTGNNLQVDTIERAEEQFVGDVPIQETKYINGLRITLNKIVEDSRCPIDAVCIQAGKLVANVTLKSDTDEESLNISSETPVQFDSFIVTILGAQPAPMASNPPEMNSYKVTFKVENI